MALPAAKVLERWFARPVYTLAALEELIGWAEDAGLPHHLPRLGVWEIEVTLDHLPHLPQVSKWLYDAGAAPTTTAMITRMPELA